MTASAQTPPGGNAAQAQQQANMGNAMGIMVGQGGPKQQMHAKQAYMNYNPGPVSAPPGIAPGMGLLGNTIRLAGHSYKAFDGRKYPQAP